MSLAAPNAADYSLMWLSIIGMVIDCHTTIAVLGSNIAHCMFNVLLLRALFDLPPLDIYFIVPMILKPGDHIVLAARTDIRAHDR